MQHVLVVLFNFVWEEAQHQKKGVESEGLREAERIKNIVRTLWVTQ